MKYRRGLILLGLLLALCGTVCAQDYPDVPDSHWARGEISYLAGEITGYPDGTFHPEKSVTRAEFLNLFARLAYPEEWKTASRDSAPWWEAALNVCVTKNMFSGVTADALSAYQNLSHEDYISSDLAAYMNTSMPRGEIAQLLGRFCSGWGGVNLQADAGAQLAINWEEKRMELKDEPALFSDLPADLQARLRYAEQGFDYDSLLICANQGLMAGYPDGTFRPQNGITRAEAAAVLARLKSQLALREDGITYLCTVGKYWLMQWESAEAVGLSLYEPLTGTPHEKVCFRMKEDLPELTLQLDTRLLTGSDGKYVWGLFGLYRKNGDTLDILYSSPVVDYCMDGETMYYLTCDASEPAYYSGAGTAFLCADTVCRMTQEQATTAHLVLAGCEKDADGIRKADQNLTDIYFENGKLYVLGSYFMGMSDQNGALYEVKDGALAAIFGQLY